MKKQNTLMIVVTVTMTCLAGCATNVEFHEHSNKIDVHINDQHFTSYLFGLDPNKPLVVSDRLLAKPVLFPVYSPNGVLMTRGYPFLDIEGENRDHPHHMGVYFTIDINEDKFWGNSRSDLPAIKHIKVLKKKAGKDKGQLSTLMHWVGRDGQVMLEEKRDMTFWDMSLEGQYAIDMDITLSAPENKVVITDTKEGLMAVRVAPWLNEKKGTGRYLSSNGEETEKNVWGKRAKWMRLQGYKDNENYGMAIFNHPESVNYPTFWHARGYGCFSANPLGQGAFERSRKVENASNLNLTIEPGTPVCFKFRLLFYEGSRTAEQMENQFQSYVGSE